MIFKTEDEAFLYYLEQAQSDYGWDITEDLRLYDQLCDDFNDWMEVENITWDE